MDEAKRFRDRFDTLFEKEGLKDVKFFVRSGTRMTLEDFVEEANKIQDTITAGGIERILTVDGDAETRRFDAPF